MSTAQQEKVKNLSPRALEKKRKKTFLKQREQADCGIACMGTIIRWYGGNVSLEKLRELSGTGKSGTSMLGMVQAAPQIGLSAEGLMAGSMQDLIDYKETPCILHVIKDEQRQHFVVYYGYENGVFLIGDPEDGLKKMTEEELEKMWPTKAVLEVKPNEEFVMRKYIRKDKFRWIYALVKDDINLLLSSLGLGIFLAIVGMATGIYTQKLVDDIIPSARETGEMELLVISLFLFGFVVLVQSLVGYVRAYFLLGQSRDFNNRIINKFYGSILGLPKYFFDSRKVGEMIARMNDTGRIQDTVSSLFSNVAIDVLMVIALTVGLAVYYPGIGLLALLSAPIYFTIVYYFNSEIVRRQKTVMQAYAMSEANYVDTIQGVAPIKEGNYEKSYTSLTQQVYGMFQQASFNLGKLGLKLGLISSLASTALKLTIVSWAAYAHLTTDDLELGEMFVIIQFSSSLIPLIGRLAMLNVEIQEAKVAFDRMYEFAAMEPEYKEEVEKEKVQLEHFESLEIKDLSFRFPGRSLLLQNVSVKVKKGEMIAILGESGCGKSTLMQILMKFYKFESGDILVNDKYSWDEVSTPSWRELTSGVRQEIKVFNGTLLSNMIMGAGFDKEGKPRMDDPEEFIESAMQFAIKNGFHDYFDALPMKYATILGEEGLNLSGGQQQILALARALWDKPELLLLDEATSAMDRKTEGKMLDMLDSMKEDMGIVFVTHRIKTASRADRIYVIEDGVISSVGTHEELMKTDNFYSLSWQDLLGGTSMDKSRPKELPPKPDVNPDDATEA